MANTQPHPTGIRFERFDNPAPIPGELWHDDGRLYFCRTDGSVVALSLPMPPIETGDITNDRMSTLVAESASNTASGGGVRLSYGGVTSGLIPYDDDGTAFAAALAALLPAGTIYDASETYFLNDSGYITVKVKHLEPRGVTIAAVTLTDELTGDTIAENEEFTVLGELGSHPDDAVGTVRWMRSGSTVRQYIQIGVDPYANVTPWWVRMTMNDAGEA